MSQLGRIGGQVLSDNLLRAGVNLAFENDLLYLDVVNKKIGIRRGVPVYDLDVNDDIKTTDLVVTNQLTSGNLRINAPNTFSTVIGGIAVKIAGTDIFHDRLTTANLEFNDNFIGSFSNSNIVFDPNGTGTVELQADTNLTGNLAVTGNINVPGNLTGLGTLTIGDQTFDTVTVNTDFTQSIIPGTDIAYNLGTAVKQWSQLHLPDWTKIENWRPLSVTLSEQLRIDGVANKISAIQSNEDVLIIPDTGITYIEQTKWQDNDITNLLNSPITLSSTGIGYYRIGSNNGMVIPSGTTLERRVTPELGETRWNTDLAYLECFDGTIWTKSTGGGEEVSQEDMNDLGNIYTLILG